MYKIGAYIVACSNKEGEGKEEEKKEDKVETIVTILESEGLSIINGKGEKYDQKKLKRMFKEILEHEKDEINYMNI